MSTDRQSPEELLLDFHLDRLDETRRADVEQQLRDDVGFAAQSRQLGRILQPLDYWQPATIAERLADNVLSAVREESSKRILRIDPEMGGAYRPRFMPVRNLVATAACVLLLVGVFVPSISTIRNRAQRSACASNLSTIFRGTATYQEAFDGSLPYAGDLTAYAWLPGADPDRPFQSNSRHGYLLVKHGFGPTPADFACPADKDADRMDVSDYTTRDDFARAVNVSYDSLNLNGGQPTLRPRQNLVYMGDRNPLFAHARFDASVDPDTTNSRAHGRGGQTVLTLDGRAAWAESPVIGPDADNIWLAGSIRRYRGVESRSSADDVQLIPGCPTTDPDCAR